MISECPICHNKLDQLQCKDCRFTFDPNNRYQQQAIKAIYQQKKCDYCNRIFQNTEFGQHYENCEIRRNTEQYYEEQLQQQFQEIREQSQQFQQRQQQGQFHQQRVSDFSNILSQFQLGRQQGLANLLQNSLARLIRFGRFDLENEGQPKVNEDNLQKFKYLPNQHKRDENTQCSICLSNFQNDEELIMLQCTHRYHAECITSWLNKSPTCPICRYQVGQ